MSQYIAVIHFIGLALFSTQVPNDPGLRVLIPRVTHVHGQTIETHSANIIYDEQDLLMTVGWTSEDVPPHLVRQSEYSTPVRYKRVRLNGERITFLANGSNPALAGPTMPSLALPKPTCGTAIANKPPLAAMVAIPGGELTTCMATFDIPRENRFDTKLLLRNNSVITVWAESPNAPTKALVLKGNATVYVTNVPEGVLTMPTYVPPAGMAHFMAYYELLKSTSQCQKSLAVPTAEFAPPSCPRTSLRLAGDVRGFSNPVEVLNSECGNSSWP